jgi:hypothetical protein
MADKLLFILTYVKQNPIQELQGQLFGMSQSHANKWIHLLHTVLNHALGQQELLPARTAAELATLLTSQQTKGGPMSPLFGMMVLSDRSPCDAQLFRPTASSCRLTPWHYPAPTLAQGPGAPRVRAGPVPPTQHSTSRTHVEPVDRCGSGGETRIIGA